MRGYRLMRVVPVHLLLHPAMRGYSLVQTVVATRLNSRIAPQ
jgi:hypothetical protein